VLLQIGELTTYPGAPSPPTGARDCVGVSALERYYECVDGWIAVACTTVDRSAALLDALAIRDVDPEAALDEDRDGALAARLAAALRPMSVDHTLTTLHEFGAPAVPVLTLEETYTDPYLHENGFWESYQDPASGSAEGPASSARFARTPTGYGRAAPGLGEHSAEVLRELGDQTSVR
jgi:crotonobetainyl-CoA:carnitine CoA-transferase CaiB-like acyl-CoA transferase